MSRAGTNPAAKAGWRERIARFNRVMAPVRPWLTVLFIAMLLGDQVYLYSTGQGVWHLVAACIPGALTIFGLGGAVFMWMAGRR